MSFPNLEHIASNKLNPPFGMHFEHTYYLSKQMLEAFVSAAGFEVIEIQLYKTHSIFLYAEKRIKTELDIEAYLEEDTLKWPQRLADIIDSVANDVRNINEKIRDTKNICLYGAHFMTQYLIQLGLNTSNVDVLLDNSDKKQNNYLYGYNFKVKSPEYIRDKKTPIVICRMGIYNKEIIDNLKRINPEVIII
jgi:hypothetical protein